MIHTDINKEVTATDNTEKLVIVFLNTVRLICSKTAKKKGRTLIVKMEHCDFINANFTNISSTGVRVENIFYGTFHSFTALTVVYFFFSSDLVSLGFYILPTVFLLFTIPSTQFLILHKKQTLSPSTNSEQ